MYFEMIFQAGCPRAFVARMPVSIFQIIFSVSECCRCCTGDCTATINNGNCYVVNCIAFDIWKVEIECLSYYGRDITTLCFGTTITSCSCSDSDVVESINTNIPNMNADSSAVEFGCNIDRYSVWNPWLGAIVCCWYIDYK